MTLAYARSQGQVEYGWNLATHEYLLFTVLFGQEKRIGKLKKKPSQKKKLDCR